MNTLLTLAFLFAVGSFLGWCLEVVFRHFVTHKWINPGFLIDLICRYTDLVYVCCMHLHD